MNVFGMCSCALMIEYFKMATMVLNFNQYFSYIVAVSFIGGGNRRTRRNPLTYRKSLTNFTTLLLYTKPWSRITEILLKLALNTIKQRNYLNSNKRSSHQCGQQSIKVFLFVSVYLYLTVTCHFPFYTLKITGITVVHQALIEIRTHNISGDRYGLHR
jgi:hypothetical protein